MILSMLGSTVVFVVIVTAWPDRTKTLRWWERLIVSIMACAILWTIGSAVAYWVSVGRG